MRRLILSLWVCVLLSGLLFLLAVMGFVWYRFLVGLDFSCEGLFGFCGWYVMLCAVECWCLRLLLRGVGLRI